MNALIITGIIFVILALIIDIKKELLFKFVGSAWVVEVSCQICMALAVLCFFTSYLWHVAVPARQPENIHQLAIFMPEMVVAGDAVPQGETGLSIVYVGELMASNKYYVLARTDQKLKPYDRVEVSTIDLPPADKATDTAHIYPLVVSRITHRAGKW